MKKIIFVLILLISTLSFSEIVVDFFGVDTCLNCAEVKTLLEMVQFEVDDEVVMNYYDLDKQENQELKYKYMDAYEVPQEYEGQTPLVFIGDEYLIHETASYDSLLEALQNFTPEKHETMLKKIENSKVNAQNEIEENFKNFGFWVVLGAGLIDGINPCAFVVLLFLISYLYFVGRESKDILISGLFFALGIFIAYLVLGMGLLQAVDFLESISSLFQKIFYPIMAGVTFFLMLFSLVDFFRMNYGNKQPILGLSKGLKQKTHSIIRKSARSSAILFASLAAGLLISFVEFMCTGQIYLPTIVYLVQGTEQSFQAFLYLMLYNLGFIIPIIGITLVTYFGISAKKIQELMMKQKVAAKVKLVMAALFGVFFVIMLNISLNVF